MESSTDILFQVFKRGWFSGRGSDHLSEAEIGFNRVNSFLAGGLARRLDEDLIMEAKKDQGVWQSGKTEYYTKAGKNKDSAQSRIDRSWSARGEDGKSFHGFGTKRQALQTKQQYDAWCKRSKTGYMNYHGNQHSRRRHGLRPRRTDAGREIEV